MNFGYFDGEIVDDSIHDFRKVALVLFVFEVLHHFFEQFLDVWNQKGLS
jgi:hypothetical protein